MTQTHTLESLHAKGLLGAPIRCGMFSCQHDPFLVELQSRHVDAEGGMGGLD